jgi:alpha-amylase/alpha-mannosidase (GH57 family)
MARYLCIHGHFYQPPRENPWLEAIELQDSAAPFHDWNERITKECYGPNAASRMLDADGLITRITNNYSWISFNFGPTLLSWLQAKEPRVYAAILDADGESRTRFSGHGSALAQAYNHPILPLMEPRDRRTTIVWGLRDFEHRFGRFPEGMWLPETAVDLATLEILAELGVQFTILAPNQAKAVRALGDEEWTSVEGSTIDPSRAYLQKLPSGREINLFFYDGPISRAVAFERLLDKGEHLAGRLTGALSEERSGPQLVHIATDGESYGHHHRYGDMALAYALATIDADPSVELTNYGSFLERHPPAHEVQIIENTSWSCAHGIERWRSDCGCNSGGNPGWSQAWRAPLRQALDWLRDSLASRFEQGAAALLADPWKARDDYIAVLLDRSPENVDRFFREHAAKPLAGAELVAARKLLEIQRNALLMYTSCGWFFDELSGIETVQVIQYAARALQLDGGGLERPFLDLLEKAQSNVPANKDGRIIFEKFVRPAMVDIVKVAAHHAVSSVFAGPGEHTKIFCYTAEREDHRAFGAGRSRLVVGRTFISSGLTGETERLSYAVLHFGDHILDGAVRKYRGGEAYEAVAEQLASAFSSGDLPGTIRLMGQHFDASGYSLRSLFRDEQRRILRIVIESAVSDVQTLCGQVYEANAPLMRFVRELGVPQPRTFEGVAQLWIVGQCRAELAQEVPDADHVRRLLEEADQVGIQFDHHSIGFAAERAVARLAARLQEAPEDLERLADLEAAVRITDDFPFDVDLWEAQNYCYELAHQVHPRVSQQAAAGDGPAREWVAHFLELARLLTVRVG